MDYKKKIVALTDQEHERILLAQICERMQRAEQRCMSASSAFLTPREQALLRPLLPQCHFWGGVVNAERAMICYIPDYMELEDYYVDGPVACIRASFYEEGLTHRDMLGALMGAGVRRDAVGDICMDVRQCDFFVMTELVPYLLNNLTSAGRVPLHLQQIDLLQARKPQQALQEMRVTVASLRLDSVISAAFHLSRSVAAERVSTGHAVLNDLICQKPDRTLAEGDTVSVRGAGKLRVLSVGGTTKKGRVALVLGKYI